ncbi:DUF1491 family protein [Pelagibacterium limicola]|uniref:DUF1491 family protein n=1 Tax=Pelagibacterium limicola TaxID=2791022 RepID=UPI0018AFA7D3|nr:DUF1491 family protein [Pelagibacterium limicola]
MSRLRSDIWCSAFVRRHNDLGRFCVVSRRGDPSAGQIWVEVDHLNGTVSLFTPAPSALAGEDHGARLFQCRFDRTDPLTVRERIAREVEFDDDLWVLSVEMRGDDYGLDLVSPSA